MDHVTLKFGKIKPFISLNTVFICIISGTSTSVTEEELQNQRKTEKHLLKILNPYS